MGFSAETGELSENHDIISVSTKNLYSTNRNTKMSSKDGSRKYGRKSRKSGGWGWFFMKFIIFGIVVTGGYVGFTFWRTQRNRSRF